MQDSDVGVIGASSFIGLQLLSTLTQSGWCVVAFTRQSKKSDSDGVEWRCISSLDNTSDLDDKERSIPVWICTAPIWVLPDYFSLLESYGVKRVVAFSSTSRFTKGDSSDPAEQAVARRLIENETRLQHWAEEKGIDWIIVRPTLVYGMGKDKNVVEIMRLIRRWGFFPILGAGRGLRQPVHVEDVAVACQAILESANKNRVYTLSGGETLSYKEMVKRTFMALGKPPRFIHVPRWGFRLALIGLRRFSRFQHWSVAMAERMDRDLVFDHQDATVELGFSPRPFLLEKRDRS